ncbi:hypothetical protein PENTCL1PPCAC_21965, partial [Pristionchus entomophagus]
ASTHSLMVVAHELHRCYAGRIGCNQQTANLQFDRRSHNFGKRMRNETWLQYDFHLWAGFQSDNHLFGESCSYDLVQDLQPMSSLVYKAAYCASANLSSDRNHSRSRQV